MKELEKAIEARVVRWAKKRKIKIKKKEKGELLDRWFFLPKGYLLIIEFKRPNAEPPKGRQKREIKDLRELGYDVQIHDNSEKAIEAIQRAIQRAMEAKGISKEGTKIYIAKRSGRIIPRPRTGENKHNPSRNKNTKERKANK
jgi:uncharacterized protein YggL (DUF469 family)